MCYIFEKRIVQGYQKWNSHVSDTQIQKIQKIQIHKYTNTAYMTKCQKDPTCVIFLKRGLFKDIKNYIPIIWHNKTEGWVQFTSIEFRFTSRQFYSELGQIKSTFVPLSQHFCTPVSTHLFPCVNTFVPQRVALTMTWPIDHATTLTVTILGTHHRHCWHRLEPQARTV